MSIRSARSALAWAGGVQAIQDVAQFGSMLILVRLLSPAEYGAMALAQAVSGVFTLVAPSVFVTHALQARDPTTVDWDSHFSASVVVSAGLAFLTVVFALAFAKPVWGTEVSTALTFLALAVLAGGPAQVRNTMLHSHHQWARYRLLCLTGTFLSLSFGIGLGIAGAGIIALAIQPVIYVLPSAVDAFRSGCGSRWRFDRESYREVVAFGLNRAASSSTNMLRGFTEQSLMAAHFSLGVNGVYSRSLGLASLLAGRFGGIATGALYPIVTRAEQGSQQFRRNSHRVLQGVAWICVPAATYLSLEAQPLVAVLYGSGWDGVATLMPPAAALAALGALHLTVGRLLLANDSRRASLAVDTTTGIACIVLAVLLLPQGPAPYLWAIVVATAVGTLVACALLVRARAADIRGVIIALIPPLLASAAGGLSLAALLPFVAGLWLPARVAASALCFSLAFTTVILLGFRKPAIDLLAILPGGSRLFEASRQSKIAPDQVRTTNQSSTPRS